MSKIESHSVFGHYSQTENRVTAALLQILKMGGTEFIGKVISELDDIEFPSSEINIVTQEKENKNVYDGLLECNFSFRVLVESKIKQETINVRQLEGLIDNAKNPNDYILFISPENKKPEILNSYSNKIYWANWKGILGILKDLNPKSEPLNFLILEFEKYLDFLNLLEVVTDDERVQIAAGSWGEPVALKYNFYACQNNRTIKKSRFLAFYNNRGIHTIFEILGDPKNNVNLLKSTDPDVINYLHENEPNYPSNEERQFYKLKLYNGNLDIGHFGKNKKGKKTAYTMGVFRYTTIDRILKARTTEEI
ncbi:hypothetical protein [Flavobacterium macacae]|uniref:Uncharacterized protein n=1 Tax=Flavobacterium macacae TaxID=2488993 RepID=A0A3P3W6F9_9FLAO|nr:hypothetical protein [Flavobacterium macacae]RRJ90751.1 hypothetical protein EG849_09750 [Flavobacterium macacae]